MGEIFYHAVTNAGGFPGWLETSPPLFLRQYLRTHLPKRATWLCYTLQWLDIKPDLLYNIHYNNENHHTCMELHTWGKPSLKYCILSEKMPFKCCKNVACKIFGGEACPHTPLVCTRHWHVHCRTLNLETPPTIILCLPLLWTHKGGKSSWP